MGSFSWYTKKIPKPMVNCWKAYNLLHIDIIQIFGYKDFIIRWDIKGEYIKKYFSKGFKQWKIKVVKTGNKTMTGKT